MSLNTLIVAAAEAGHEEPAVSPWLVGGIALSILLFFLMVVLMFGAGREHS